MTRFCFWSKTLITYFLCLSFCYCQFLETIANFQNFIGDNFIGYQKNSEVLKINYDFVIVGSGSAGAVLANRLSENKQWAVLLLEAGKYENYFTDIPLTATFQSSTDYNWKYKSEKCNTSCLSLKNGRCNIPRGKAIGGTSVINFMVYTRGNKKDFDEWESYGNSGWKYNDVLPYFLKSENYSSGFNNPLNYLNINENYHGKNGYLSVQHSSFQTPILREFLKAGKQLGYKITDPNGKEHVGFSKVQATIINGRRQSTGKAFIKPILHRKNLDIITEAHATRILIHKETKSAYGVEFLKKGRLYKITVTKEVLISAGAINSPQLLMLSGIGPREELERLNIPVIQNLKVGYNLQDHVSLYSSFLVNTSVTVSDLSVQNPSHMLNYMFNGRGPLTLPGGAEGIGFVKTKYSTSIVDDYPDIELVLGASGINNDFFGALQNLYGIPSNLYRRIFKNAVRIPSFSITTILLRPRSKGQVTLKSSNPLDAPAVQFNYFHDKFDTEVMVEGLKLAQKIGESDHLRKYNSKMFPMVIPNCSHLKIGTDEYLTCLVQNMATGIGHHVGTCKMGPINNSDSVVDSELKVHFIKNLRVVDGSIMPNIVAGHTNSVIIMIAEKASTYIKNEWS